MVPVSRCDMDEHGQMQEMLEIAMDKLELTAEVEMKTREAIGTTQRAFAAYARLIQRTLIVRNLLKTQRGKTRVVRRTAKQMQSESPAPRLKIQRASAPSVPSYGGTNLRPILKNVQAIVPTTRVSRQSPLRSAGASRIRARRSLNGRPLPGAQSRNQDRQNGPVKGQPNSQVILRGVRRLDTLSEVSNESRDARR